MPTSPQPAAPAGGTESIGALLVRLRTARGISQLRLAELLCAASGLATVTRHEVSRWERAERVPSDHWLRWLAAVLERPVGDLEAAARVSRAGRVAASADRLLSAPPDAAALLRLLDQGRADLVRLAHTWLAGHRPAARGPDRDGRRPDRDGSQSWSGTAEAGHRHRPHPGPAAAVGVLDLLAARLADLRRADDLVGGADLAGVVLAELRAALGLLAAHRLSRRLLGLVAGLAQLAGWTAADAGRHELASRAYAVGLSAATAAGDRALGAHLLGCMSHLVAERDPPEALLLARTAYAGARQSGAGGLRALLLHRVAFAAALAGERRSSEAALAAAERVADRRDPDREPGWLYWLDTDELTALSGRCFAALRRPLRAEPLLRQRWERAGSGSAPAETAPAETALTRTALTETALTETALTETVPATPALTGTAPAETAGTRPPGPVNGPRTVAIDGGWLAQAYLDAGEIEQACWIGRLAVLAAVRSGSPRAAGRALAPRRRLAAATGSAARDYLELVAAAEPYLPRPGGAGRAELASG